MRRAALAVVIAGIMFGGMVAGLWRQPVGVGVGVGLAAAVSRVAPARPAMKAVGYDGYMVSVPASWPVYDLNKDPRQCVRYDIHAVYLGTPGPDQDCPAGLVGRVDTVTIAGPAVEPAPATAGPAVEARARRPRDRPSRQAQPRPATGDDQKTPVQAAQQALALGTVLQDPQRHELALAVPDAAPRIEATYGADPGSTVQILATFRPAGTQQAATRSARPRTRWSSRRPTSPTSPARLSRAGWPGRRLPAPRRSRHGHRVRHVMARAAQRAARHLTHVRARAPVHAGRHVHADAGRHVHAERRPPRPRRPSRRRPPPRRSRPSRRRPAPRRPRPRPCRAAPCRASTPAPAPSLTTMKAWRSKYSATAIYIGGQEMACGHGNLSANWVQQTEAIGWSLMPIFVGLQAPCDSFSGKINPKQAASQGTAAANEAVSDANYVRPGQGLAHLLRHGGLRPHQVRLPDRGPHLP